MKLRDIATLLTGNVIIQQILEAIASKGAEVGAEAVKERIKSDEEWRDEMYAHWVHTSLSSTVEEKRTGAEKLIERHRQASESTHKDADALETRMMHSLGKTWFHTSGTPRIRDNFFYLGLGHMDDDEFAAALDALHDDKIQQWIGRISRAIEGGWKKGAEWANKLFHKMLDVLTGHKDLETTSQKLEAIFKSAVSFADNMAATAVDAAGLGLDAVNEGLDKLKERGGLWNRLIA